MMERILLGVLLLSGWSICTTRLLRQYHYVPQIMTWTEAQTYCRQNYADLATIENSEEMEQVYKLICSSGGCDSEVWIGLYSFITWQWADGYTGSGAEYRRWGKNQPDFYLGNQHCIDSDGVTLWDDDCTEAFPFICNKGTQLDPEFVLVTERKDWCSAQTYCRNNFFNLATARNEKESLKIQGLLQDGGHGFAWIGLFRSPSTLWSDGSTSSFTAWELSQSPLRLEGKFCGASSKRWTLKPCDTRLPFVCNSDPSPPVARQFLKLKLKVDDSSVDLNDPVIKASILKKLQDRLKEGGLDGVNLKWREQPDGKVFHKEDEGFEKKTKKKKSFERNTEL